MHLGRVFTSVYTLMMVGVDSFKVFSGLVIAVIVCIYLYSSYFYHETFILTIKLDRESEISSKLMYPYQLDIKNRTQNSKGEGDGINLTYQTGASGKVGTLARTTLNTQGHSELSPVTVYNDRTSNLSATQHKHHFGYILALKIYEQQTMATGNLLQLQCFASKLDLLVVQPFMKNSKLFTPLDESQHPTMLQLEEVYKMEGWSEHAKREGYAPLVRWEEFIKNAPRNVILVQMKYPSINHVKRFHHSGMQFPHALSEERNYKRGCGYSVIEKAFNPLRKRNFSVIRNVCYNFLSGDEIPFEVYHNDLLGHNSENVTIIIDEWRGLSENQRVLMKEKICAKNDPYRVHTEPSSGLLNDIQLYMERYLQRRYLAVIARYEMTALTCKVNHTHNPASVIDFCLQDTLKHLDIMKKETGLMETFLSIDIGKYGSFSFARKKYYGRIKDMENFVGEVYQRKMSMMEWERTFEDVAKFSDNGYIADMQQGIVARAKCILFVGGGTFQEHTLHLYKELNPDPTDQCFRVVKKCTSSSRPIQ